MISNQKGFTTPQIFIFIFILVLVVVVGGYVLVIKKPVPIPEQNQVINLRGMLVSGGVECQGFQGDDGKFYTLTGDFVRPGFTSDGPFKNDDVVNIEGVHLEQTYCQQGTTIEVSKISKENSADETVGW